MSDFRCICDPLTNRGEDFSEFVGYWFSQCVYSSRDYAAFLFGLLNLFIWFTIHIPQIIANIKTGSAAALSPIMLALWVFADACGTIGLLLTGQQGTMLLTQCYYLMMDSILFGQYFYFSRRLAKQKALEEAAASSDGGDPAASESNYGNRPDEHLSSLDALGSDKPNNAPPMEVNTSFSINTSPSAQTSFSTHAQTSNISMHTNFVTIVLSVLALTLVAVTEASPLLSLFPLARSQSTPTLPCSIPLQPQSQQATLLSITQTLLFPFISTQTQTASDSPPLCAGGTPAEFVRVIGTISAWVCSIIYSLARLGQVKRNYVRKSTAGLSPSFILLPIGSGFAYFLSIMLPTSTYDKTDGFTSGAFWASTFPYVLSCVCNLIFNGVITFQIWTYRKQTAIDEAELKKQRAIERNDSGEHVDLMQWNKQDPQNRPEHAIASIN